MADLLLLHFNGNLTDSMGRHTLTAAGTATTSTTQKKFGTHSLALPANGDHIYFTDNLSDITFTGDFTIDAWIYPTSFTKGFQIFNLNNDACHFYSEAGISDLASYSTAYGYQATSGVSLALNTWTHCAITRSGSTMRLFVNGVMSKSWTSSATLTPTLGALIGKGPTGTQQTIGYIDELRLANTAAWTADFTPPTAEYGAATPVTITAAAGSYALTGTAAALLRKQVAAGGAYTLTGTAASFVTTGNLVFPAAAGSYTVTGTAAGLITTANFVLPAAAGAYAITGAAAGLITTANFVLPAAAGSYTLTGSAAAFITGNNAVLATDPGAYTVTGSPATFIAGATTVFAAAAGAYTLTGSPATLVASNKFAAAAGSYTITGAAAGLVTGVKLAAAAGNYALTGSAATFIAGVTTVFTAASGAYTVTGSPAGFIVTALGPTVLPVGPGAYTVTGTAATFVIVEMGGSYTGGGLPRRIRKFKKKEERRDELEELLELVRKDIPPELAPEPELPGEPSPPPPALIDLAPQAPRLMTAVGLTSTQRAVVKQGIVSEDEADDEQAIAVLLELLA